MLALALFTFHPGSVLARDDAAEVSAWSEISRGENISVGAYLTYAPDGSIRDSGKRVGLLLSYDRYLHDDAAGVPIIGSLYELDLSAGGAFDLGKLRLTVAAGPAVVYQTVSSAAAPDATKTLIGAKIFVDSQLDLGDGLSLNLAARYRTILTDYSVSGTLAWPLSPELKAGLSAQLKGNRDHREFKLGPQISDLKIGRLRLTANGGVSLAGGNNSAFAGLSTWMSF